MSNTIRKIVFALLAGSAMSGSAPLVAEDAAQWDRARAELVASQPGPMASAISRWQQLTASSQFSFDDYANFILANPGFPDEAKLRGYAEARLETQQVPQSRLIAFFDRFHPLTNPARAQYALALSDADRGSAAVVAREAWRGGSMNKFLEETLLRRYGSTFTQEDDDARMDALLWSRDVAAATRQLPRTSPERQAIFNARLIAAQGSDPSAIITAAYSAEALKDPGYVFNMVRQLRSSGRTQEAVTLLSTRPEFAAPALNKTAWVTEMLTVAKAGNARSAQRIAASVDDAFEPGEDVSAGEFRLRDDYTSLMWLGGTRALWELNEPASAAPLFYRYGTAARSPYTRSKGFYWAGLAAAQAGDRGAANRYFEQAAAYPDRFYGMLALERLGRPLPDLATASSARPSEARRAEFLNRPLTKAVREVARDAPWSVGIRFYREIAAQAETEEDFALVAELAREIGRRDLAVILADEAASKGHANFGSIGYPIMPTPAATDWTMIHAITRQESQFAQNARSHAGAQGLMQLMPGTAREQAGKLGLAYLSASVINDADYNIRLGEGYFTRMLNYYGGSYPLAVAAYNAGPGNVNKWLRANGDPRQGGINWVDWIERIPIYETKNYVQRVLENAVVYQSMYPNRASPGPQGISGYLGKKTPG